jgi:hypothetical protein
MLENAIRNKKTKENVVATMPALQAAVDERVRQTKVTKEQQNHSRVSIVVGSWT